MLTHFLLAAALATAPVAAKHIPGPGSPERTAILDALRPSVEAKFKVPVEFVVSQICVAKGTAVVIADPRRKGGGAIPWQNYMTAEEHDIGGHDVSAVLRFRGGRWNLVDSGIGATDVWYENLVPVELRGSC